MKRLLFTLPLLMFVVMALWIAVPLVRGDDPNALPSTLIDQPAPDFALPPLPGHDAGFTTADLGQRPVLVNVFASWCTPCLAEHPLLTRLAEEQDIPIYGINYKNDPADAVVWLGRHGDPYAAVGVDREGRVALDWGVYGVPETFVVDAAGHIRFRHPGPLTPDLVDNTILPLLAELGEVAG